MLAKNWNVMLKQLLGLYAFLFVSGVVFGPVFRNIQEEARQTACLANERQIGVALLQYTSDYDGYPPPIQEYDWSKTWRTALHPYTGSKAVFECPDRYDSNIGLDGLSDDYSVNCSPNGLFASAGAPLIPFSYLNEPDQLIAICESDGVGPAIYIDDPGHNTFGQRIWAAHSHGGNFTMADGHVKWMRPEYTIGTHNSPPGSSPINFWYNDSSKPLSASGVWQLAHDSTDGPGDY